MNSARKSSKVRNLTMEELAQVTGSFDDGGPIGGAGTPAGGAPTPPPKGSVTGILGSGN